MSVFFFFFNDTATTEIYTLSLHDALPISPDTSGPATISTCDGTATAYDTVVYIRRNDCAGYRPRCRSEEHTSELQSQSNLVCRLLLEKKKRKKSQRNDHKTCSATTAKKPT